MAYMDGSVVIATLFRCRRRTLRQKRGQALECRVSPYRITIRQSKAAEQEVISMELESYVEGKWQRGSGNGVTLVNPATEQALGTATADGIDFSRALEHARNEG